MVWRLSIALFLVLVLAGSFLLVGAASRPATFTTQTRVGFTAGDQWEPAIATDLYNHVYILYPQYITYPGCPTCANPTMALVISSDGGATWAAPRIIGNP